MATFRQALNPLNGAAASLPSSLKLFCGTWNAGNARPPADLSPWLPAGGGDFDLIVVGLQECTFKEKKAKPGAPSFAQDAESQAPQSTSSAEDDAEAEDPVPEAEASLPDDAMALLEHEIVRGHAPDGEGNGEACGGSSRPLAASSTSAGGKAASLGVGGTMRAALSHKGSVVRAASEGVLALRRMAKSAPSVAATCAAFDAIKAHLGAAGTPPAGAAAAATGGAAVVAGPASSGADAIGSGGAGAAAAASGGAAGGARYQLVSSLLMWQIGILVFVRTELAHCVDEVQTGTEATGLVGLTPNKGGVAVKLRIGGGAGAGGSVGGGTTLAFVASHLAAHLKHNAHRNLNAVEITNELRLGESSLDLDSQFSHVFWMGDLNYRVDLGLTEGGGISVGKETPEHFAKVHEQVQAGNYAPLLAADQLAHSISAGAAFTGWQEQPIAFGPTFKVARQPGCQYNPARTPSWCDRVLWKSLPGRADELTPLSYSSHPSIATSDHKPVSATFAVRLRGPAAGAASTGAAATAASAASKGEAALSPASSTVHAAASAGGSSVVVSPLSGSAPSSSFTHCPLLRVRSLAGRGLLGMDVTGKSDPYVLFLSDVPLRAGGRSARSGHSIPRTAPLPQTVDPSWPDVSVDEFRIGVTQAEELSRAHLFLVIMDEDVGSGDDRMGQAVLCLRELAAAPPGTPVPFHLPVTKGGRKQGQISGTLTLTWPDAGGSNGEAKLRAGAGKACCALM